MNAATDTKTLDLLPDHDLAGERPAKPSAKELAAARIARYRAKHQVKALTLQVTDTVIASLEEMAGHTGETKSQFVARMLTEQSDLAGCLRVEIPVDVRDDFQQWVATKGKGRTPGEVIEKLIRTQLLRPR